FVGDVCATGGAQCCFNACRSTNPSDLLENLRRIIRISPSFSIFSAPASWNASTQFATDAWPCDAARRFKCSVMELLRLCNDLRNRLNFLSALALQGTSSSVRNAP